LRKADFRSDDIYTRLIAGALFPLHEKLKGHRTGACMRELAETQWWDRGRLEQLQLDNLRVFLRDVARSVPYYSARFADAGFDVHAVRSITDLTRLPFLTKSLIRNNVEDLKATDAKRLIRYNTGGSSGEPLVFFMGLDRVSHDVAAKWRATRWWGVDVGDPEMVVWGSPIELHVQDWLRHLRDLVFRTELLPAFDMAPERLDHFIQRIKARRPRMLFGYPSALAFIARHADIRGVSLDDLGIRVVFVTSESLYQHQREQIERTFGCPVANGYGGRDAGFIAHECPKGALHLMAEDVIVETVDDCGKSVPTGCPGEIVVTHLATRDFPFIRYRTGDVGVLDDRACICGRGLPILREVQGRTTDFVVAMDGTVMHGLALIYVMRVLPGIRTFKIVQETIDRTRVLVVPEGPLDPRTHAAIVEGIRARLGPRVTVVVEAVDEIAAERSGKHRYVTSDVTIDRAPQGDEGGNPERAGSAAAVQEPP
jgi:phenylacetate-CoA ligase